MSDDKMQSYFEVSYDTERGELISTTRPVPLGDPVVEMIRVRLDLQEKVLRQACIYELEKLGYTIVPPEKDR